MTESIFFILQNIGKLHKNCREQKKKFPDEIQKKYRDKIWTIIVQNYENIIDKYAEKYFQLYPHLRNFYIEFKKDKKISGLYLNDIRAFLHKIMNHFILDYPELYMKISGWCSIPEFTLPKKDILKIFSCKTREEYVKLFLKKI